MAEQEHICVGSDYHKENKMLQETEEVVRAREIVRKADQELRIKGQRIVREAEQRLRERAREQNVLTWDPEMDDIVIGSNCQS